MTLPALLANGALFALFLLGSWFFSGFESGMTALNRHRLHHQIRRGDRKAKAMESLLADTHRFLATILVGHNLCCVALSTLAAALAVAFAERTGRDAALAQSAATALVAVLLLLAGEFLPKLWFTARPNERCRPFVPLFRFFRAALYPLASLCMALTHLVAPRRREGRPSPFLHLRRENLAFLMRDSEAHGRISAFERQMACRVLDLQLRRAAQMMTPRSRMACVSEGDSREAAMAAFRESGHQQLPMLAPDGQTCTGILALGDLRQPHTEGVPLRDLRREAVFVSGDRPADELLPLMRRRKTRVLLVADGKGSRRALGMVTQEDVLKAVLDDELLRASTDRKAAEKEKGQ